ncbi:hypothetical protein ScPMuIL_011299 [Solemya velum]
MSLVACHEGPVSPALPRKQPGVYLPCKDWDVDQSMHLKPISYPECHAPKSVAEINQEGSENMESVIILEQQFLLHTKRPSNGTTYQLPDEFEGIRANVVLCGPLCGRRADRSLQRGCENRAEIHITTTACRVRLVKDHVKASNCNTLMIAAIDFGTTFSGYAFSFRHELDRDPTKVSGKVWHSRTGLLSSMKVPTCLLLKPNKTFAAFGYDAENMYSELAMDNEHRKWYYFKRFKMMLHDRLGMPRDIKLEDVTGKKLSASTVFALAIKFLKNDLLDNCKDMLTDIYEKDIHWVLTTPAIWTDAAKQFMREVAVKAGIKNDALEIALEPEAASVYCRHIPLQRREREGQVTVEAFSSGSKYLILDAGGGTVDVTVHEVTQNRAIKELHQASGGPWGGTRVDEQFQQLLISILGSPVLVKYQQEYMEDYLELLREFELKKRTIQPNSSGKITFRAPMSLREMFETETGETIQDAIANMPIKNGVSWVKDKVRIDAALMKRFFEQPIKEIIEHIKTLLQQKFRSVSTILMVGGFSESGMLQNAVRRQFPEMQVIIPPDAGSAVLKGAVIYGHNPLTILERKCKYTYGVAIFSETSNVHHEHKHKKIVEGIEYCSNIFSKHVEIGETVRAGESQQEQPYTSIHPNDRQLTVDVFASTQPDPKYTTDDGCVKLGTLTLDMPVTKKDRGVKVQMFYSGTEIGVRAKDEISGETTESKFDFLG